jgi:hypothetical protein
MGSLYRAAAAVAALLVAQGAQAWPASLQTALVRDACRLVPKTLARLISDREREVVEEAQRLPVELGRLVAADALGGHLQPETLAALDGHLSEAVSVLRQGRVSEGVVRLGATMRIPADLADPGLASGSEGYPPGLVREYYAFIEANMDRLPVTLDEPGALKLQRSEVGPYWQVLLDRSREQSLLLRREMFQNGRVLDHRGLDWRSPVFAVAQVAYSRAVTGIAATWLALWRQAHGDLTRQPSPRLVEPRDAPPLTSSPPED